MKKISQRYSNIADTLSAKFDNGMLTCLLFLVYKAMLDVIYLKCVGGVHTFFSISVSPFNIITGWMAAFVMSFFFAEYYRQNTPSAIIMIIFNLFYFLPMTTFCSYGGGATSFLFWGIQYWIIISVLQLRFPAVSVEMPKYSFVSDKVLIAATAIVSLPVIYVWARYTKFRILVNPGEIYTVRAEAAAYAIPTVLQYALNMIPILIAMLIVLTLYMRKYILFFVLLALTVIDFSIAGHKSVILFPVILIGGYIFYRKNMISVILPAGIIGEVLAIAEHFAGKGLLVTLVFRRMGFVLAQLSEYYYRFFTNHDIDMFRQGIIGKLGFDSIYSQSIAHVIGNNFETQVVNCNNGLMADVWSGLGYIGIIVMPVILLFCFRLLDSVARGVDLRLIIGLVVYYAACFANSQWSTVLITHGFVLMCLVLLFFPRTSGKEE